MKELEEGSALQLDFTKLQKIAKTGLPVAMQDESLTTADAHERMIEAGISRERRAELVDKLAAAAILQAALDAMQR